MISDHVMECAVAAVLGAPMPPAPCCHLADCDEPAPNLMPDPCPNCGRWYVNDDNSVEPETYDGRRRRVARAVYGPDRMKVPPYRPGMHDHISEDDGKPGSGQPRPRATQQGAATPGHGAIAQDAVQAAGDVAEPQIGPEPDRADRPSSSTFSPSNLWHMHDLAEALGFRNVHIIAGAQVPGAPGWFENTWRATYDGVEYGASGPHSMAHSSAFALRQMCQHFYDTIMMLVGKGVVRSCPRAAIIKLIDSDATAGQLRAELALLVGQ